MQETLDVTALGVVCPVQHGWNALRIYIRLHIHAVHLDSSKTQYYG